MKKKNEPSTFGEEILKKNGFSVHLNNIVRSKSDFWIIQMHIASSISDRITYSLMTSNQATGGYHPSVFLLAALYAEASAVHATINGHKSK